MTISPKHHSQSRRWLLRLGLPRFWLRSGAASLLVAGLAVANGLAWIWAFLLYGDNPAIVGPALLAWLLGFRHAVDADHIAAIDNVVRKLMHDGQAPRAAGLYFALGHSTVVVAATVALASAVAIGLADSESLLRSFGSVVGTSVSAAFLLLIAIANLVVLFGLWRKLRARGRSEPRAQDVSSAIRANGFLVRLLGPVLRMVSRSWHMYPLGFVFGLGFDTATEIGLLSMSATEAARGAPLVHVLVFPALFAAAMATVDTADSMVMTEAYRWAQTDPDRRLRYNLLITGASVVIALLIGSVEVFSLLAPRLGLVGGTWEAIAVLNTNLANLGIVAIGLFAMAWIGAVVISRRASAVAACRIDDKPGAGDCLTAEPV